MGISGDAFVQGDSLSAPQIHDPRDSLIGTAHFVFNGVPRSVHAFSDGNYRPPDGGALIVELDGLGIIYSCGLFSHGRSWLTTAVDSLKPLINAALKATEQPGFVGDRYKDCLPIAEHQKVPNADGSWNVSDVDVPPEFPGGNDKLLEYMASIQQHTDSEYNAGIQGTVFVRFTVNDDGSISDIMVLRRRNAGLDAEAERIVASMPKWTPARIQGKTTRCRVVLPIRFVVKEAS
jgi:TonB family protein